jgi:hypothetical protein
MFMVLARCRLAAEEGGPDLVKETHPEEQFVPAPAKDPAGA